MDGYNCWAYKASPVRLAQSQRKQETDAIVVSEDTASSDETGALLPHLSPLRDPDLHGYRARLARFQDQSINELARSYEPTSSATCTQTILESGGEN